MHPILYSFRRCPYAMRARLALAAADLVCELREVILSDKPAALRLVSPKATVPVLVLPDGVVIDQSLDIMLWALRQADAHPWLGKSAASLQAMLEWVHGCDGTFKQNLDRYKYPGRYGLENGLEHRTLGAEFLQRMNARLQNQNYLMGNDVTLADMAVAPFVRQFSHTDKKWFANQDWLELQRWLYAFEESVELANTMKKYAPWTEGQPAMLFT